MASPENIPEEFGSLLLAEVDRCAAFPPGQAPPPKIMVGISLADFIAEFTEVRAPSAAQVQKMIDAFHEDSDLVRTLGGEDGYRIVVLLLPYDSTGEDSTGDLDAFVVDAEGYSQSADFGPNGAYLSALLPAEILAAGSVPLEWDMRGLVPQLAASFDQKFMAAVEALTALLVPLH